MARRWIIDGYNVIHRIPELREALKNGLAAARRSLLARLQDHRQGSGHQFSVVFDGDAAVWNQEAGPAGVEVLFSRTPSGGDSLIKRLIQARDHRQELTLVSSDRELQNFAKARGVEVLSAEAFFAKASAGTSDFCIDDKFGKELSTREVAEWLELFKQPSRDDEEG